MEQYAILCIETQLLHDKEILKKYILSYQNKDKVGYSLKELNKDLSDVASKLERRFIFVNDLTRLYCIYKELHEYKPYSTDTGISSVYTKHFVFKNLKKICGLYNNINAQIALNDSKHYIKYLLDFYKDPFNIPNTLSQHEKNILTEKHIVLEDIDPVVFYGVNNGHLQMVKSLYPKLRIVARDNVIRVLGDEDEMAKVEMDLEAMRRHVVKYNTINDEDILDIIKGQPTKADSVKGVLVYSVSGRPIKSRSENQQRLIDAFNKNDMTFAVGPAGSGKTYLSIALAVKALKEKAVKKIILSRPAVEAGEKLGFLPGDMKDKIDPYLQPLYDALEDMLPASRLQDMMDKHVIQIAPLAFMRGRTLSDAIVILDEAQNTTPAQIRMFLTRMGWNTKMIITGDMTQIDLPRGQKSGLKEALEILSDIEGISVVNLTQKDIVRHKLVTRIVDAYADYDKQADSKATSGSHHRSTQETNADTRI